MSPPPTSAVAMPRVPARWRWALLVGLGLAFFASGFVQARRDAPTVDEGVDLSSGVSGWVRHDVRMVPEHPPLGKAIAALPALFAHPVVPDSPAYRSGDWFDWSDDFISANERAGTLRPMLVWARSVVLLEAIGCAALLYVLARRWFGPDGGLVAAAAWLTTPYLIGLSHFAMIDVPFTLVTLVVCLVLARWRDEPTLGRAAVVGLAVGAALATRHTGLVLAAVVVVTMVVAQRQDRRRVATHLVAVGLVSVAAVWVVYRGLAPAGPSGPVAERFHALVATASAGSLSARLVTALPLPLEWRAGFSFLDLTSTARPTSLLGQSWDGGRWWYFPASAALKLPLTLVAAIVAGWAVAASKAEVARRDLAATVVAPGLALWVFLLAQPLDLGLRLALPVVALAYVGLGGVVLLAGAPAAADRPRARTRWLAPMAVLLIGVQLLALAASGSHSLAWTPVPWTPGYRWVSDSNIDAGQGLYEVRTWSRHRSAWVAIDGTRGLQVGAGTRAVSGADPSKVRGWVAVGVTPLMQTRRDELSWLRKYCPVGTLAGGSVLVYRFTGRPDPSPGPERPVSPCWGASRSRVRS